MSQLSIRQQFTVGVPPERVWPTLLDPAKVVLCLPGASLDGAQDERTFKGSLRVSMGPVTVGYRGTIVFEEVDHGERRVRVSGRGREATGSGSASLTMESRVTESERGSLVTVQSEVQVTGKLVTFGRGMIERVSREMLDDFARRLDELLAGPGSEEGEAAVAGAPFPGSGVTAGSPAPPPTGEARARSAMNPGPGEAATGAPGTPRPGAAAAAPPPLNAARLLWRVLVRYFRELFGRRRG